MSAKTFLNIDRSAIVVIESTERVSTSFTKYNPHEGGAGTITCFSVSSLTPSRRSAAAPSSFALIAIYAGDATARNGAM